MRLTEVAALLSCGIEGDGSTEIVGVETLERAGAGDLSFLANPKYFPEMKRTKASALIVGLDVPVSNKPLLRHSNPYLTFAKALEIFHRPPDPPRSIHPTAVVSTGAKLGKDLSIGAHAYIGENVMLGDRVVVGPNCTILDGAVIGDDSHLHAGCVLRERVRIGKRCIIQSNAVIGSDGFGYAKEESGCWYRILQSGTVVIEDDVDVGASSTIDRAALGETVVRRGTKIDNMVQVGHGCQIDSDALLCAQVGLAGSTRVGKGVILAGQVGAAGHLTIGDGAIATPQTGIANSVEAGAVVSGAPAIDHRLWLKTSASLSRLPEIQRTIRRLAIQIKALEAIVKTDP